MEGTDKKIASDSSTKEKFILSDDPYCPYDHGDDDDSCTEDNCDLERAYLALEHGDLIN